MLAQPYQESPKGEYFWLTVCSSFFDFKNVNRKVQGMPQSQTAANPRHQEEEKKDKNIHARNKQTNVREAQRPAPSSPSEVIRMLKQTEKRGQRARERL